MDAEMSDLMTEALSMNSAFDHIKNSMMALTVASDPMIEAMQAELDAKKEKKGKGAIDMVGKSLMGALGPMALLSSVMEGFLEPVEIVTEPLTMIGEILGQLLYPFLLPIADVLYFIMPYLQLFVDYLSPMLDFFAAIGTPFGIIADGGATLLPILILIGDWFGNLGDSIGDAISNGFTAVTTWFGNIWTSIISSIVSGFWVVTNWFASIPQLILNAITGAGANIQAAIARWWEDLWD